MSQHNRAMFRWDEPKIVQGPKLRTNILMWYVETRELANDWLDAVWSKEEKRSGGRVTGWVTS